MKKKWLVLVSLMMLLCLLPLEGLAIRYGDVVCITNSNAVNVRKGPGTSYGVLGEAQPTNLYVYLGSCDGWECILYQGQEGYVASSRVSIQWGLVPDEYGYGDYVDAIVRVTHGNALNVRSGPGKKYSSIGQAKPGSTWEYLGMDDGWNVIDYNGYYGYIAANRTEVVVTDVIDGTSEATSSAGKECGFCKGTGELPMDDYSSLTIECYLCNGTGRQ